MKTGLHLRTNNDGTSLFVSPGRIRIRRSGSRNIDMRLRTELEIAFAAGDVAANDMNYIIVTASSSRLMSGSSITFTTTEPTKQADGFWYTNYGTNGIYSRVIGAFPGDQGDNRFPLFYQNGTHLVYTERPDNTIYNEDETASGGGRKGWGFWNAHGVPGNSVSEVVYDYDLAGILPVYVEHVEMFIGARVVDYDSSTGTGLWLGPKGAAANDVNSGFKVFSITQPGDQEAGLGCSLKLGTGTRELQYAIETDDGSNFHANDRINVTGQINGYPLPYALAESQAV